MARHLLVTNDYPPKTGGIQVYLHELWRRLEPGRAVVLTASSHPTPPRFDATSDVVIERVAVEDALLADSAAALAAIEAAIERHQPDLVLLDPAWPLGLLGPRLSRPYGVVAARRRGDDPRVGCPSSRRRFATCCDTPSVAVCAGSYPESEARRNAAECMPPVDPGPAGRRHASASVRSTRRVATQVRASLGLSTDGVSS